MHRCCTACQGLIHAVVSGAWPGVVARQRHAAEVGSTVAALSSSPVFRGLATLWRWEQRPQSSVAPHRMRARAAHSPCGRSSGHSPTQDRRVQFLCPVVVEAPRL